MGSTNSQNGSLKVKKNESIPVSNSRSPDVCILTTGKTAPYDGHLCRMCTVQRRMACHLPEVLALSQLFCKASSSAVRDMNSGSYGHVPVPALPLTLVPLSDTIICRVSHQKIKHSIWS